MERLRGPTERSRGSVHRGMRTRPAFLQAGQPYVDGHLVMVSRRSRISVDWTVSDNGRRTTDSSARLTALESVPLKMGSRLQIITPWGDLLSKSNERERKQPPLPPVGGTFPGPLRRIMRTIRDCWGGGYIFC